MATRKKVHHIEKRDIDGFAITYEMEEGRRFAYGNCPICGKPEEAMEQTLDAGKITASKLKTHIMAAHPESEKGKLLLADVEKAKQKQTKDAP